MEQSRRSNCVSIVIEGKGKKERIVFSEIHLRTTGRIGPAGKAGHSAGMRSEHVSPQKRKKEPYKAEEQLNRSVLGQVCSSTLDARVSPPPGMASSGELSGEFNSNEC